MRLPHDVFPTRYEHSLYVGTDRVRDFMLETRPLSRDMVVACLLKNIDIANDELARLRKKLSALGEIDTDPN